MLASTTIQWLVLQLQGVRRIRMRNWRLVVRLTGSLAALQMNGHLANPRDPAEAAFRNIVIQARHVARAS